MDGKYLDRFIYIQDREGLAEAVEIANTLGREDDGKLDQTEAAWKALPGQIRAGEAYVPLERAERGNPAAWLLKPLAAISLIKKTSLPKLGVTEDHFYAISKESLQQTLDETTVHHEFRMGGGVSIYFGTRYERPICLMKNPRGLSGAWYCDEPEDAWLSLTDVGES
jgi:hypothetical protein